MDSTSSWGTLFRLTMGGSWVISMACQIAIIVVVATVVRRHRPDAWKPLLWWSLTAAATSLLMPVVSFVSTQLAMRGGGVESMYKSSVVNQLISIPLHSAWSCCSCEA